MADGSEGHGSEGGVPDVRRVTSHGARTTIPVRVLFQGWRGCTHFPSLYTEPEPEPEPEGCEVDAITTSIVAYARSRSPYEIYKTHAVHQEATRQEARRREAIERNNTFTVHRSRHVGRRG
eukprot:COSAG04_NODE_845_length_9916_cov_16.855455_1_plen_121_part_00